MNYLNYAAAVFLLIPIAAIAINNICPKPYMKKNFHTLTGTVAVFQIAAAAYALCAMNANGLTAYDFSILSNLKITGSALFRLTPVSLIFLLCIGMVAFVSVAVASKTVESMRISYVNLLMTMLIGMNGMVLVKDLFTLYVFLDVVGISSFVLISLFRSTKALEGSVKYLVISEFATIFILTALAFIFMQTGSLAYQDIGGVLEGADGSQKNLIYLSIALLIAGFSIKAGAVPFHSWLPDAHQSADTAVSILLSGIVIKIAGVYGLFMVVSLFPGVRAVQIALAAIGVASILTGALLALRQTHFKRIVAYSSVSQIGYILLGLSCGTTVGLIGAVAHVFSHAAFKTTLFSNAAALHEQVGTLDIDKMGGLQSRMPVTSLSSVVAFLSTAGIPPFAGFWSKLLIIIALWTSGSAVLGGVALIASIFTCAYLLRLQKKVFFGETPEHLKNVTEVKGGIKFVEIALTVITSATGILFPLVLIYLQSRGLI
ncbi:MAG TPA: proton-conducting transporter membrane subunit [Bacillota bacterium]|nr:proton-conducting transporter membrane subunit [Bacillota bacterium]HOK69467.1 proton-conducting transporter membrane subunit [Bacillota bacterium]HPP86063.1 proton-conducting transporter membrane subunit [Bacillota bacterium]